MQQYLCAHLTLSRVSWRRSQEAETVDDHSHVLLGLMTLGTTELWYL